MFEVLIDILTWMKATFFWQFFAAKTVQNCILFLQGA